MQSNLLLWCCTTLKLVDTLQSPVVTINKADLYWYWYQTKPYSRVSHRNETKWLLKLFSQTDILLNLPPPNSPLPIGEHQYLAHATDCEYPLGLVVM